MDGGVLSAESLGRGNTIASNIASPAAGSENPASLAESPTNATYATALVGISSDLPDNEAQSSDPLTGKVLQYLSLQGEKGVIFYEPLSRINQRDILDPASPTTDYRDVEYDATAFGFAGANKWGAGSIGISMAYLHSSIGLVERRAFQPDRIVVDTADGLRINLGVRYPTGPAMWGVMVQNLPGVLWGKDYHRNIFPMKTRIGNTVKIAQGVFLSADWERRFYHEGSNADNYVYVGLETFLSEYAVLRGGMFGTNINKSEERHSTAGITLVAKTGARLSYAIDIYEQDNVRVKRSLVSIQAPFTAEDDNRGK